MTGPLKLTPEELAQEALRMQSKLAAGLETLREVDNFDYGSTARQEVWRDGKTVLYRFVGAKAPTARVPILVSYALVNRAGVSKDPDSWTIHTGPMAVYDNAAHYGPNFKDVDDVDVDRDDLTGALPRLVVHASGHDDQDGEQDAGRQCPFACLLQGGGGDGFRENYTRAITMVDALSCKLNEAETALLTGADGMVAKDASIKARYV